MRRIFAHISPNLAEKYSKQNDLQKNDCISFYVGRIFSNQATFLPKFPLTCPKRTKEKHDLQKQKQTKKYVCTLILVPFL